jgi:hypothetical protein
MRRAPLVALLLALGPLSARPADAKPARPAPADPRGESPEERLARGRQAYLRDDFHETLRLVAPLLYPTIQLRSEDDVVAAHRLLALAHLFQGDEKAATDEFNAILQLRPGFALDPASDPPAALRFLERLRAREAERLLEFERRQREAAEQAAREAERRRKEEEERIRRALPQVVVVRTVERHHLVLALVPFGVGQFQNREPKKAIALLTTQLALAAASIAIWSALQVKYDFGRTQVPLDEIDTARALQASAIVLGSLFWADALYGVVDALVHFRSHVVVEEEPHPPPAMVPPPRPAVGAVPLFSSNPGAARVSGAALVLQGVF